VIQSFLSQTPYNLDPSTNLNETNYSTEGSPLEGDNMTEPITEITEIASKITTRENIPFSEIISYLRILGGNYLYIENAYFLFGIIEL
jgi:hypothetical protein